MRALRGLLTEYFSSPVKAQRALSKRSDPTHGVISDQPHAS